MKKINKYLIFSFFVALITLLITSKNSFLYILNDWVDANAFFTVGKSMFNKIIIYKDLFEQKGPLLYLIYGIGYLISHKTFHGVFILEVISFTIFLYYLHKIFKMYFNEKYSLILLPIIGSLVAIMPYFVHGGSCEEFCLPFITVSLYYYFKNFKEELTKKEILINGIMAGCILTMKYTILGFWIGLCTFISINYLIKKEYKKLFEFCSIFLAGMLIPFIIWIIYFLINNGLKEFIDVYFRLNMTAYTNNENYGIIKKIIEIHKYLYDELGYLDQLGLLFVTIFSLSFITKEKNTVFRLSLLGLIYTTMFFMAWGLKAFIYYYLPIYALAIIIVTLFIIELLKKIIDKIIDKKIVIVLLIPFYIGMALLTYKYANYKEYMNMKKEDFIQYKYAKYMSKYENPTLLNMGFLDIGVYTVSGIIPNTRFFEVQNFDYDKFKDNIDEMKRYVENKEIKFIVYVEKDLTKEIPKYIYDNYKEVYNDTYYFEGNEFSTYLFKLKNIKEK